MAFKPVEMVQPPAQVQETKHKKGGGGLGQILGGVGGAILAGGAAAATGGAALPIAAAALGGAGGGAALGGLLGEKVKPTQQGETAMARRAQVQAPQLIQSDRTQKLRESIMALHSQPPEVQQQHAPTLVNALMKSLSDDNTPRGVA